MKQSEKNGMLLLPVPMELLEEIGLGELDVMQMSVAEGRLIIEKADSADYECDGDCENCPFAELDCDGDCAHCPCCRDCDESEVD